MIKTLRRKFVVTAMTAVTALLLVLLGGINGVNLWLKSRDTDMLLTALSEGEGTMRPERRGSRDCSGRRWTATRRCRRCFS